MKPKHGRKANLCHMDIDSFIFYIETEEIYINTAKHVETRLDTSNYELERLLPKGKNRRKLLDYWINER